MFRLAESTNKDPMALVIQRVHAHKNHIKWLDAASKRTCGNTLIGLAPLIEFFGFLTLEDNPRYLYLMPGNICKLTITNLLIAISTSCGHRLINEAHIECELYRNSMP